MTKANLERRAIQGKDHWHHSGVRGGDTHLFPGDDAPDAKVCLADDPPDLDDDEAAELPFWFFPGMFGPAFVPFELGFPSDFGFAL